MWGHMNETWGWGSMWLGMLLIWGVLIGGIILLVRYGRNPGSPPGTHEKSAPDILKERYARGEIDRDEFVQKKRDLTDKDGA